MKLPLGTNTLYWVGCSGLEPKRLPDSSAENLLSIIHKHCGFKWSLREALEVLHDAKPRVDALARRAAEEAADAKRDKDKMISEMMGKLKEDKNLVDVGDMMRKQGSLFGMPGMNEQEELEKEKAAKTKESSRGSPAKPKGSQAKKASRAAETA